MTKYEVETTTEIGNHEVEITQVWKWRGGIFNLWVYFNPDNMGKQHQSAAYSENGLPPEAAPEEVRQKVREQLLDEIDEAREMRSRLR